MNTRKILKKLVYYNPLFAALEFCILSQKIRKSGDKRVLLTRRKHQYLIVDQEQQIRQIFYNYKYTQLLFLIFSPERTVFEDLDTRITLLRNLYSKRIMYLMLNNDFLEYLQYFADKDTTPNLRVLYLCGDDFELRAVERSYGFRAQSISHQLEAKLNNVLQSHLPSEVIFVGEVRPNFYKSKADLDCVPSLGEIVSPKNHIDLYQRFLPTLIKFAEDGKITYRQYFNIKYYYTSIVRENSLLDLENYCQVKFFGISDSEKLPSFQKAKLSDFKNKVIVDPGSKSYSCLFYERVVSSLTLENKILNIAGNDYFLIEL